MGYPGETEDDFAQLLDFAREVRFERLGVFAYSEEEGTYSARELRDDVPEAVKQERVERVMALQNGISLENNRRRVGRTELRHHRLAAGRLLRGPHAVRLARGGPGDPHPGSGPAAPARPVLRRADHLGGRLRSLRRNKPVSHSPRSQAGDAASEPGDEAGGDVRNRRDCGT